MGGFRHGGEFLDDEWHEGHEWHYCLTAEFGVICWEGIWLDAGAAS